MEFAASHHSDDLSQGALDGMESLLLAAQSTPNGKRQLIVMRLTQYVLNWIVRSSTYWSDESSDSMAGHIKLLYRLSINIIDRQTFMGSVSTFCCTFPESLQPRLQTALGQLFAAGCENENTFAVRAGIFAAATRGFTQNS